MYVALADLSWVEEACPWSVVATLAREQFEEAAVGQFLVRCILESLLRFVYLESSEEDSFSPRDVQLSPVSWARCGGALVYGGAPVLSGIRWLSTSQAVIASKHMKKS